MKRIFFILLLLFGYAQAQNLRQYKPMLAGKTNEWQIKGCFTEDPLNTYTHLFRFVCDANDTIIKNGKKYLQLREINYADTVIAYVREDTLTRCVYVWGVKNHSQEVLTLNFSLNAGDTIAYPFSGGLCISSDYDGAGCKDLITDYSPIFKAEISFVNDTGGVYGWGNNNYGSRRVFETNDGNYIEEIGWSVGGVFNVIDVDFATSRQMLKRLRNGEILFEAGTDELIHKCNPLGFTPFRPVSPSFKIYPTLCEKTLCIETDESGIFMLYQTNGFKILEENFDVGKNSYSIERLPTGVYYARVLSKNNKIFTQKIVKIQN